jgi:hypothetical protein
MSDWNDPPVTDRADTPPGSIERTLAGHADLRVGEVIREAWDKTDGIKGMVIAGGLIAYGGLSVALYVLGLIFAVETADPLANAVSQLVFMMIIYPFMSGVFMFGLKHSVGAPVRFDEIFAQYGRALPIVAVALLQSLATGIGFILLIFPGLYLSIALSLAVALKVERDLPVLECLATSMRLVNRKFLAVLGLMVISAALMLLGFISLIGWIWAVPWTLMIFAITYRQLAGIGGPGGASGSTPRDRIERATTEF